MTAASVLFISFVAVFVKCAVRVWFVWIDFYFTYFILPLVVLFCVYLLVRGAIRLYAVYKREEHEIEEQPNPSDWLSKRQETALTALFWLQIVSVCTVVVLSIAGISRAPKDVKVLPSFERKEESITIAQPLAKAYRTKIHLQDSENPLQRVQISIEGTYGHCDGLSFWWYARQAMHFSYDKRQNPAGYREIRQESVHGECYQSPEKIRICLRSENGYIYAVAVSGGTVDLLQSDLQETLLQVCVDQVK